MTTTQKIIINQCISKCSFDRSLNRKVKAKDLRGAIANLYNDNMLFHQHGKGKNLIYNYPLIQYKIIEGIGVIVGLDQGATEVAKTNLLNQILIMRNDTYIIENCVMSFLEMNFGICKKQRKYKFLSPWLALNECNYRRYQRLGRPERREKMLERILTGNIISMSKGVGYTISEQIKIDILNVMEIQTKLKGIPMLGFSGTFFVNFEIPDYWGIGKSVSRGFGTVKRVENE